MEFAHATYAAPPSQNSINIVINGVPLVLTRGDCIRFRRRVVEGADPMTTARILDFGYSGGQYVNRIFYLPWREETQRWGSGTLPLRQIGLESPHLGGMSGEDWRTITKLDACPVPVAIPSIAAAPLVGVLDATFMPKTNNIKVRAQNELHMGANAIGMDDPITSERFVDGEEVVVLQRTTHGFKHMYKRAALEEWFMAHPPPSEPLTRKVLTQAEIERYTLRIIIPAEGGARRSRRVHRSRRSRRRGAMKKRVKTLRNNRS